MYCNVNTEAQLCNQCCSRKVKSITYSECVFVALGAQREMHIGHIFICGLSSYNIFFHITHKQHNLGGRELLNIKCVF